MFNFPARAATARQKYFRRCKGTGKNKLQLKGQGPIDSNATDVKYARVGMSMYIL